MSHESASQTSGRDPGSADENLSVDDVFKVLAHEYRHLTLSYLLERDGEIPVEELVAHITTEVEKADKSGTATMLHHVHLPKMEDAGIINYGQDRVELTDTASTIEPPLRVRR